MRERELERWSPMPHRTWIHDCCDQSNGYHARPYCLRCGHFGAFHSWRRSVPEAMAFYEQQFGLKPIGPHRRLAGRLLWELRIQCAHCDGVGLVGDVVDYAQCQHCEGGGGIWTASDDEIRQAYRRILKEYPDAAGRDGAVPDIWRLSLPR